MLIVTLLALALATTEPVPAPASAAEPAPKTKAERDKEKVCIDITPTGSVISKKVCKSRRQWRQLQDAQKQAGEAMLDTGSSNQSKRE